jgi:hypothetical protein
MASHLTPPGMTNRNPSSVDASHKLKGGSVNDGAVRSGPAKSAKPIADPAGNRVG